MTIAVAFNPSGTATDMIDDMFDLLVGSHVPIGVAELQDGTQLFVLNQGRIVTEEDVLYELSSHLITCGYSLADMGLEIKQAMIDVNP